jgi:hypothetical protein
LGGPFFNFSDRLDDQASVGSWRAWERQGLASRGMTVIARQCQRTGVCTMHIDAIAALAGCCRTVVKNAVRQARLLGLVLVKERRIPGQKSLTNIISIVSKEWLSWLKLGVGVKRVTTTDNHFHSRGETARTVPHGGSYRPYIRFGGSRSGLFG